MTSQYALKRKKNPNVSFQGQLSDTKSIATVQQRETTALVHGARQSRVWKRSTYTLCIQYSPIMAVMNHLERDFSPFEFM